jgi:hypothetical protein
LIAVCVTIFASIAVILLLLNCNFVPRKNIYLSNILGAVSALCWGICLAALVYTVLQRPKLELFDEGIRITNPIREITVGWDLVESIDAKYTMSITVGGRIIYAWAAPAPGRHHTRKIHPSDIKGTNIGAGGYMRPGDNPRTHSGAAAYLATLRLNSFRSSNRTPIHAYEVRTQYIWLIVIGATAALAMLFTALHHL